MRLETPAVAHRLQRWSVVPRRVSLAEVRDVPPAPPGFGSRRLRTPTKKNRPLDGFFGCFGGGGGNRNRNPLHIDAVPGRFFALVANLQHALSY